MTGKGLLREGIRMKKRAYQKSKNPLELKSWFFFRRLIQKKKIEKEKHSQMPEFATFILLPPFAFQNFPNRCANCFVSNKRNDTGRDCKKKHEQAGGRSALCYSKNRVLLFLYFLTPSLFLYI